METTTTMHFPLYDRLRAYAVRIIRLSAELPHNTVSGVIGNQMLRSGTSPGAHYAEARRAKSTRDFINLMQGALKELEETRYWLELLIDCNASASDHLNDLIQETGELIAICIRITQNARKSL